MLILALESSAKSVSCAVCDDAELLGQYYQNSKLTHSRTLLSMAEALLKNLDVALKDIGLIAVSHGPGSFTGVRIGVAAAKGLAWGLGIPVCGVSPLHAMAFQTPDPDNILCCVMDARRGQVYNALFKWKDGMPVRLCDDRAISLDALAAELRGTQSPCLLLGDGAALSYESLHPAGVQCRMAPGLLRWQTAYGIALAAMHVEQTDPAELAPVYLRPSQAERVRNETEI